MQGSGGLSSKVVVMVGDLQAPNLRSSARWAELRSGEDACPVDLVNPRQNTACSDSTVGVSLTPVVSEGDFSTPVPGA